MAESFDFHRKYRPKVFREYVGNTSMVEVVKETLANGARPQVILMTGPAGCGKTSMARLLAAEYCCENRDPVKGACGVCESCKAFAEYIETGATHNLMDLTEVDCTNIGKEKAEQLVDEMYLNTISGGWRVFILDEVHALSQQAMSVFLKPLEEPPERRLVVLCTTNPEKMLDTLRTRCQKTFTVQKPTQKELCQLLAMVCRKESIPYEDKALGVIATKSEYTPRQALIFLQEVYAAKKEVTYKNTVDTLHTIADDVYYKFMLLLTATAPNPVSFLKFLAEIRAQMSFKQFLDGCIAYVKRGLYIYNGVNVEGLDKEEIKTYGNLFCRFEVTEIAYILDQLMQATSAYDLEFRFILWGYTGLRKSKDISVVANIDDGTSVMLDTKVAMSEHQMGVDAFNASKECTATELANMISEPQQQVDKNTLFNMFANAKILNTTQK